MPRSEEAKANKKKYDIEYIKTHYKRVPLDIAFEKYDEIKAAAEKQNESVNGYIKSAIDQRLDSGK